MMPRDAHIATGVVRRTRAPASRLPAVARSAGRPQATPAAARLYLSHMVSLLDIIGPVMVGPSSSHTAGACRLGLLARGLVGGTPQTAHIQLHGSFARTGEGHGTDKAIVGGLMGFRPDDERLRDALDIMERDSLAYTFEKTTLGEDNDVHPNTVRITLTRNKYSAVMQGSSLGAGRVLITQIDGYPVEVTGNLHTIVLVAEDVKGSVARIATLLADAELNIATLRLSRKQRGGDAFMVIELDESPGENVRDTIRALPWVRYAFRLDKVGSA
jgi:L-serine dehydratase